MNHYTPVWHNHTPAYLERSHSHLTLRLKTVLPAEKVDLQVLEHGEIMRKPTRKIAPLDGEGHWFEAQLPVHEGRLKYSFVVYTIEDRLEYTAARLGHTRRPFRDWFQYEFGHVAPKWAWKSMFYQIFPDRFRNGDPSNDVQTGEYQYEGRDVVKVDWSEPPSKDLDIHGHYGGDLQGIEQALPYLKNLGVNALWLTPIFESPSAHKYDTSDYLKIDPHFGGQEAFESLRDALHDNGMKLVLDGVFNHVGEHHHIFKKALQDDAAPERSWFNFTPEQQPPYIAFYGVRSLPKINYSASAPADYFWNAEHSVVRHWLRQGIDGWRLDVASMIGNEGTDAGNVEHLRNLKKAARAENPQAYVFGERSWDGEWALDGLGEDGAMNYHGFKNPLMDWLSDQSLQGHPLQPDVTEMSELMWDAYHVLPASVALSQFNQLDSHDVMRAITRLEGNKQLLKAALLCLMAYPGVPCLYYGTEIGLDQPEKGTMPFNRKTMPWDEALWDHDLLAFVKKAIQVRKNALVLQEGDLRLLYTKEDVFAFTRSYTHKSGQQEMALFVLNKNREGKALGLPSGHWQNALTGETVSEKVEVPAESAVLLLG